MPSIADTILATVAVAAVLVAVYLGVRWRRTVRQLARLAADEEGSRQGVFAAAGARRGEMFESVFMALGDACLLVDSNLAVVLANGQVRDLFGNSGDVAGKSLQEVIGDHRIVDLARRSLMENREEEDSYSLRPTTRGSAGGAVATKFVTVNAAPVEISKDRNAGGPARPAAYLRIVIRDITQLHETEQIRKDFVANASHELRTPLSIINGYIENFLDDLIDSPEGQRRALQTMQKHGDRIARIVEDMLTISKFESVDGGESSDLRSSTFDIGECIDDVIDRLAPLIDGEQVRVVTEIDPDAREFAGDRFYWDQVVFNLVENALKQNTGRKLRVRVSVQRGEDGSHNIKVTDNGVGIPGGDVQYVFKRFYRVAKHHSQTVKGTGLGLSIVKRAVEAHGGTITLASTPGVETTFAIMVPPREGDAEPAPAPQPVGRTVKKKAKRGSVAAP